MAFVAEVVSANTLDRAMRSFPMRCSCVNLNLECVLTSFILENVCTQQDVLPNIK